MKQIQFLSLFFFIIAIGLTRIQGQTADIMTGCAPLTVNFSPPASANSFFWDFKDQATSALASPSNTFLNPGTFIVEFRESPTGPIVGTISITVLNKPNPTFNADTNKGCSPLTVNFTNTTSVTSPINVNNYSWVYGDGGSSSGSSATHTFSGNRTFFVSLELQTNFPSCNVTRKYDDVISTSIPPNTSFITNPPSLVACTAPLNVSFTNTSTSNIGGSLTYMWDFGNSQTSTATNPPTQTYSVDGNYTIQLTATDTNNCSGIRIRGASVGTPTPNLIYKDTFCLNQVDTILNFSQGVSTWTFPPGVILMGYHDNVNPILNFTSPGDQTLLLNLSSGNCSSDTSFTIFVEEVNADFIVNPTYSCSYPVQVQYTSTSSSNAANFNWFDVDTISGRMPTHLLISTLQNPDITYNDPSTSTYSVNNFEDNIIELIAVSNNGCRDSIIKVDTIHEPNALILPSVTMGCIPLTVSFLNASTKDSKYDLVKWDWFFGDGSSISSTDSVSQSHTYTAIGEYYAYLVITNEVGCIDTSYSTLIKVGDSIPPDFTVDLTEICIGDTVRFTDITNSPLKDSIDAWHYSTESDRMFSCFGEANPFWVYQNEVGPQDVTMTVGFNGCFTSSTKPGLINVKGAVAEIYYTYFCSSPFTVNFQDSSINATSIQWYFGDGDSSNLSNPSHTYATTGDYQVILRAENIASGCVPTYDTTLIHIRNIKSSFTSDSLICQNNVSSLLAGNSEDVDADCAQGYRWIFSDPLMRPIRTSQDSSIARFLTTGTTNIQLITTDINGCQDSSEKTVRVYGIDAQFSIDDDTICFPTTVNFSDLSTSDTTITSWSWSFGNGNNFSSQQNSSFEYRETPSTRRDSNGNLLPFYAFLQVSNSIGCADNDSAFITLYEVSSKLTILDNTVCVGTPVNFSATDFTDYGSSLLYNWDFKDGNSSQLQSPSNTFQNPGEYPIELIVEELGSGCRDTINSNVSVRGFPNAGFSMSSDSIPIVCPNTNILFTDTTSTNSSTIRYNWNFGNGNVSSFQNPGTVYTSNGNYSIRLIAFEPAPYGCADTTSRSIEVRGPMGRFVSDLNGDTICRLEFVNFNLVDTVDVDNYRWDFGDGTSLDNVSPVNHQYTFVPPSGRTVAKLVLSNADGSCPVTQEEVINIYEVVANFQRNNGLDTAICFAPYPITNLSINATSWSWDFGDGTTSTQQEPGILNYDQPGTYQIQLSVMNDRLQCTDTITKEIILHPYPELMLIGDTICLEDTASTFILNPNSHWAYTWTSNPITEIIDSNANTITSRPLIDTEFYNTVVDTNNCSTTDTVTVFVLGPLNLDDFDTTIIAGDSIDLPLSINAGLYNFSWSRTDGLSCTNCSPPKAAPLDDTSYDLTLTDILGCFSYDVTFNIGVYPETFIEMPTSFTPNGDGINDLIFVEGWGIKELLEYKIVNRWGEIIFETTDLSKGWDGKYKGEVQNNDVYVYKVLVKTWRDEEKSKEGYINLIR